MASIVKLIHKRIESFFHRSFLLLIGYEYIANEKLAPENAKEQKKNDPGIGRNDYIRMFVFAA